MPNAEQILKKQAEEKEKALSGYAAAVFSSLEGQFPGEEFIKEIKVIGAGILQQLDDYDITVGDVHQVFMRTADKAKASIADADDRELYAAFIELVLQYVRGRVNNLVREKKLSTIRP